MINYEIVAHQVIITMFRFLFHGGEPILGHDSMYSLVPFLCEQDEVCSFMI